MCSTRIMVVEDEQVVAMSLCDCLEILGYAITSIEASGEESIKKAEADQPDAVLMDIYLRGEMDGITAAHQIHERFGIPVIFLTGYSDPDLLERAKHVGSFGYILKPFNVEELNAMLKMTLQKAQADAAVLETSRMEATATLAGGIAHDYNNLMFMILGNAELVRNDLGDDHPNAAMLKQIEIAASKASDLAQRLLAFARGGAYKKDILDLSQTMHEAILAQKRSIPRQIQVISNFGDDIWNIEADRAHMEMVITSLCTNAVEAIDGEGTIHVTIRNINIDGTIEDKYPDLNPGRYAQIKVEDNGCGMSDEVLEKAFEPFFTTKFQGRGMGLASVYGIVKNHNGHILIESKKNEGTTCSIYLPAIEAKVKVPAKLPTVTIPKETITILVVDDEEIQLKVTSRMLKLQGYQVLTANDGQAAIDMVREHKGEIHLVLLDIGMPNMDGSTTFMKLRDLRPKIKVILFSGYELDATIQELLDAGASSFLKKPVVTKELAEEVRIVLGH